MCRPMGVQMTRGAAGKVDGVKALVEKCLRLFLSTGGVVRMFSFAGAAVCSGLISGAT